jgi:hypothetical protein
MKAHPALLALEQSLQRPSSTPCTWRSDRDVYISEQVAMLKKCVIDPKLVKAQATSWAQQHCNQTDDVRMLIAVAREKENWLLFDQEAGTFSLAYGAENDGTPLALLGFASDDALAEWLG